MISTNNIEATRVIPGVAGQCLSGIVPGLIGLEFGQAAVGDGLAAFAKLMGLSFDELERRASLVGCGSNGVRATDW